MDLRLCFENKAGVKIDEASVFRHYAENYLSGFDMIWAGSISIPHTDAQTESMEPLWQYRIQDASVACKDYLLEYIERNPMAGYFVRVYESNAGTNDKKIN